MISCHGSSNSRGVEILFENGIDCSINHKILDPEGRYIILKACIQDKDYVLINVYAPNKDKDQVNFFNNPLSILQNENLDSVDNIILGIIVLIMIVFIQSKDKNTYPKLQWKIHDKIQ